MLRIVKQKRLLVELRHIHKPMIHRINMTQFAHLTGGRLMIKVMPNSIDEALSTIKIEVSIVSQDLERALPKNLSLTAVPSVNSCNAIDIFWYPIPKIKAVRYCLLSMVASLFDNVGLCAVDEKILKHPQFHQLYCIYPKLGCVF